VGHAFLFTETETQFLFIDPQPRNRTLCQMGSEPMIYGGKKYAKAR
jgi:hypothetical protein